MNIKFKRLTAAIIVIIMAIATAGCGGNNGGETTVSVTVEQVKRGNAESYISYSGTVNAQSNISVVPKISGKVTAINVAVGDTVEEGDVLYVIDDTDIALQVRQAEASLNAAEAAYSSVVNGATQQSITQLQQAVVMAETEYNDAVAALERVQTAYDNNTLVTNAQVAYDNAKINYERMKQLYAQGGISKQQLEAAESSYLTAEAAYNNAQDGADAQLDAAKSRVTIALNNLNSARENLELTKNVINPQNARSAAAQVQTARAVYEIALENLNSTRVKAPIAGVVASMPVQVGGMASPQTPVNIVSTGSKEVKIKVAESNINFVTVGTKALISVKSANIESAEAVVTEVSPAADLTTGMFGVTISIPDENDVFKVGMFADISLISATNSDTLIIKTEAIKKDGGRTFVYVVNGDSVSERDIVCGIENGDYTEITEGLTEGETIVVKGKDFLNADSKINIVQE